MNIAIVTYEDGQVIPTSINGTIPEIQKYFKIGDWFNIGSGENDNMQQVKSLTIVTEINRTRISRKPLEPKKTKETQINPLGFLGK